MEIHMAVVPKTVEDIWLVEYKFPCLDVELVNVVWDDQNAEIEELRFDNIGRGLGFCDTVYDWPCVHDVSLVSPLSLDGELSGHLEEVDQAFQVGRVCQNQVQIQNVVHGSDLPSFFRYFGVSL